ncbi:intracellular exo-alpha-L-arabinofuranosidase 2 [mine drainage metagenome]|uniref:Intracellular exo-alpha-L-arabinofuranosidase 2 n=1 Tax=mine drainage metagenome TaxID=410659 RepID=A0A1J5S136_9ZZZZ
MISSFPPAPKFRALRTLLGLALAAGSAFGATTQISVDANQYVRTLEDREFGINTAVWDSYLKSQSSISIINDVGMHTLRYPGGSTSDTYHWKTNSLDDGTVYSWGSNFDSFIPIIQGTNARVFITVNYGSGTAQEAADWVTYANVTKNLGIKYWEVGNECYGTWENDIQAVKHDPYTYATRFAQYYKAMKAVDPTIRVGAVAVTGEDSYANNTSHPATNPRTGVTHNGWTPVMLTTLKSLGVTPDFLIYHRYEQNPPSENDTSLLQSAKTWPNDAADLRQQLNDYLGSSAAPGVELVCTENNSVSYNPGKQSTSLVNALFYADSFGNIIQTEFNGFVWWDLRNGKSTGNNNSSTLYGWRQYGDYGITNPTSGDFANYPTYYAMKIVSKFASPGDEVVKAASDNTLLSCYAVRKTDGSVALLVINKDPANTQMADFSIANFSPGATATTYAYGIPQDTAAQTGSGNTDLATGTMAIAGTSFAASFAPYSLNVIVIPPAVASSSTPKLIALSARGYVGSATDTNPSLTIGFATSGAKSLLLRGVGPTLATQHVSGVLADPTMDVYTIQNNTATKVATNDNWGGSQALQDLFAKLGEFPLPVDSKDSAMAYAAPGGLGTAEITSVDGNPGVALGEIYSADSTQSTRLTGLSARAIVGTGDNVLVGGFIITGSTPTTVLIRGIGPTLSTQGITNPLGDPKLTLFDVNGRVISQNDDWGGSQALVNAFTKTGEFPLDPFSKDAAILITLNPGIYTAQVSPAGGVAQVSAAGSPSGVALVEIYQVP